MRALTAPPLWRTLGSRALPIGAVCLSGLIIGLLPARFAAAVIAGVVLVVVALRDVRAALVLTALVMPLGALGLSGVAPLDIGLVDLVAPVVIVAWLAAVLARLRRDVLLTPWVWPLVIFLIVVIAATPGARDLGAALKEWLRWIELIGILLVTADVARTERDRRMIVGALLIACIGEALIGFVQFFLQIGPPSFRLGPFLRAFGTFGQPNPYAGYLESVVPLALAVVVIGTPFRGTDVAGTASGSEAASTLPKGDRVGERAPTRSTDRPTTKDWDWLWFLAFLTAGLGGVALVMSFSRGGWLGLLAGSVVGAILLGRFGRILGFGGIAIAVGSLLWILGLLPATIATRLDSIVSTFGWFDARFVVPNAVNWAIVERMAHWQVAVEMFLDNPLLGVGPGNYPAQYSDYAILPYWRDSLGHAHNIYLNVAAELGVLGVGAYLIMVGSWLLLAARVARRALSAGPGAAGSAALAVGVGAIVAALAVHNVFDNLYVHGMNVQIALLLGLVASTERSRQNQSGAPD